MNIGMRGGMMKRLTAMLLFCTLVLLVGCSSEEEAAIAKENPALPVEIDKLISNHIIETYADSAYPTEKQFEVHKVYGWEESNNIITVYIYSYFGGFTKSTGLDSQTGHSLPAIIRVKKEGKQYRVLEYIEPQDGNLYHSSLKKMFPKKYREKIYEDAGMPEVLKEQMEEKVREWLEESSSVTDGAPPLFFLL